MAHVPPWRVRERLHVGTASRLPLPAGGRRSRGVALVIAMLVLALVGVVSAAVMRNALGAERIAAGHRLQIQASQFAQIALRRCEDELATAPSSRPAGVAASPSSPPAWTRAAAWTGGSALARTLSAVDFNDAGAPRAFAQCLAEPTGAPGAYVVTARGFSPDFAIDARSGAAVAGAVVWLQSSALVTPAGAGGPAPCPAACPPAVVRRSWQLLLTPPF